MRSVFLLIFTAILVAAKPFPEVISHLQNSNKPGFVATNDIVEAVNDKLDFLVFHSASDEDTRLAFVDQSGKVSNYTGDRNPKKILEFVLKSLEKTIEKDTGSQGEPKSKSSRTASSKAADSGSRKSVTKGKVLSLDSKNFDSYVMSDDRTYFIKFFAPWCGHCKAIEDVWIDLARKFGNDDLVIAEVNADKETQLAQRFGVKGFPTIIMFPAGSKNKPVPYQGERTMSGFTNFVSRYVKVSSKVPELTSEKQFRKECVDNDGEACFIMFLPHIYDSSVSERNQYIKMIKKVKVDLQDSSLPINYLWTEASNSLELEKALGLEFGWPATVLIHSAKGVYAIHRGQTTVEALKTFINGVAIGKVKPEKMAELPKWPTIKPWDGKAHSPADEEL